MLDIETAKWVLKKSKKYTDDAIAAIVKGMEYKGSVSTYSNLPITGNKKGYVYTVSDTHEEYVWPLDATSGSLGDWESLSGVTVAQLAEKMEGSDILSADENEDGTKVRIGFDMTGASAGDVPTVNPAGNGVIWGAPTAGVFIATYGTTLASAVAAAITAGKAVSCYYEHTSNDKHWLDLVDETDSKYVFSESSISTGENATAFSGISAALNKTTNAWEVITGGASIPTFPAILENGRFLHTNALTGALEYVTVVLLPDVTTEDNGKFLTVVGGAWAKTSVPDYDGSVN